MPTAAPLPAYEGLLYTVFQGLRQRAAVDEATRTGLAIAFTSANAGEGVTHTISALLGGMARDGTTRSLLVDSACLRRLTVAPLELPKLCRPLAAGGVYELEDAGAVAGAAEGPYSWDGSWEYRRDVLQGLRMTFDSILIDCPALRESNDLLSVAPFVDGIILVVEAGKTRRDQIVNAEKTIEFARGRLLGHILNKRSYAVPEWIYRRL